MLDGAHGWVALADDDTYLVPSRLRRMLEASPSHSPEAPVAVGDLLDHVAGGVWGVYHAGGAGVVLSRAAVLAVGDRLRGMMPPEEKVKHMCGDVCLGLWLKAAGVPLLHDARFHTRVPQPGNDLSRALSFHCMTTREAFEACELALLSAGEAPGTLDEDDGRRRCRACSAFR